MEQEPDYRNANSDYMNSVHAANLQKLKDEVKKIACLFAEWISDRYDMTDTNYWQSFDREQLGTTEEIYNQFEEEMEAKK